MSVHNVSDNSWGFCPVLQVLEVRPVIDWNKGKAVEFLLESLGNFYVLFSKHISFFECLPDHHIISI